MNSNSNGLSSTGVKSTAKTRRPQPRSNTKNDRVPSTSKSSCIKNNEVEVEEHPRNLLSLNNQKHMPSECNNIKLAVRNHKSEVVCATLLLTLRNLKANGLQTLLLFLEGYQNLFMVRRLRLLQAYDRKSKAAYQLRLIVYDGVDLLKENRSTNLYTINLHEMTSASHICLMSHATSTKSWLWHQRLSHLNFDTINELAKNNLVIGLPKFKYLKDHLCPSCEQGKSKKSPHKPKPIPISKNMLHLLYMDLCGPMRVESINSKRYVLVIVDDYSHYTWVYFLRSKDEAREVIKTFLKKIQVLRQAPIIIVRTDNGTKFTNQVLKAYFEDVGISHQMPAIKTPEQNDVVERRNRTLNDHEDIGKLGAKGDIGFFIGYSSTSYAYTVYNRQTIKIMETMDVTFNGLSAMDFKQHSCQPSDAIRTAPVIPEPQNPHTPNASTTIAESTPTPKNSSSQALATPNTSYDVNKLQQQQHVQQQDDQSQLQYEAIADNVHNAMFNENMFINPFTPPFTSSVESSSQYVDLLNMHTNQLRTDAEMCIYALSVSTMEPRNVNEAMTDARWIEAMQDELHQFKRLDLCVLSCRQTEEGTLWVKAGTKGVTLQQRHLSGTGIVNLGLWYMKDSGFELTGFSDADHAGCQNIFKSTFRGTQFLGKELVSWSLKKQDCTVLSTVEVEYVSLFACCAQVLWMRAQLTDYGFHYDNIPIYCDS
ncbi:retrovirus-related pol polyprotein from transposon TNT 1-94 [Tanacetum coccineum]